MWSKGWRCRWRLVRPVRTHQPTECRQTTNVAKVILRPMFTSVVGHQRRPAIETTGLFP